MGMFGRITTVIKQKVDERSIKVAQEKAERAEVEKIRKQALQDARKAEAARLGKQQAKIEADQKLKNLKAGKAGTGRRQAAGNFAENYSKSFERDLGMMGGKGSKKGGDFGIGDIKAPDFSIDLTPKKGKRR